MEITINLPTLKQPEFFGASTWSMAWLATLATVQVLEGSPAIDFGSMRPRLQGVFGKNDRLHVGMT